MPFIVKITEILPNTESNYRNATDIFEQRVEQLDLVKVIRAVNNIEEPHPVKGTHQE